ATDGYAVNSRYGLLHHVTAPNLPCSRMRQNRMTGCAAFNADAVCAPRRVADGKVDTEGAAVVRRRWRQTQTLDVRHDRFQESIVLCNGPLIATRPIAL